MVQGRQRAENAQKRTPQVATDHLEKTMIMALDSTDIEQLCYIPLVFICFFDKISFIHYRHYKPLEHGSLAHIPSLTKTKKNTTEKSLRSSKKILNDAFFLFGVFYPKYKMDAFNNHKEELTRKESGKGVMIE